MSELINGILYEKRHDIIINNMSDGIYYYFDYDERSFQVNMDFQHFHSFYEIHILLAKSASHLVEGIPYTIHAGDIVLPVSYTHLDVYKRQAMDQPEDSDSSFAKESSASFADSSPLTARLM